MGHVLRPLFPHLPGGIGKGAGAGCVFSAGMKAPFLPCPVVEGPQADPLFDPYGSDALGPVDLVAADGDDVHIPQAGADDELSKALEDALSFGEDVIVEQFIIGREFSVSVIQGKALPIIEIAPLQGFYDYKNKYQAGSTIETCPADLPQDLTRKIQSYAEQVFEALGMQAYARMDFMLDSSDNSVYCLEANTLPGMTPTSLLPQEAAVLGWSFGDLCLKILEVSLQKYI